MSDRHPILTEHPEWVALEAREVEIVEAQTRWRKALRKEDEEYEKAKVEHRRARTEAILHGEPAPAPPEPPPDRSDEARAFLQEINSIAEERHGLLAQIASEVESAAFGRETELLAIARQIIDQLQPVAQELSQLTATVRACRTADGRQGLPLPRVSVGVSDLVETVLQSESVINPSRKQKVRVQ